jgi:hypothetical protein
MVGGSEMVYSKANQKGRLGPLRDGKSPLCVLRFSGSMRSLLTGPSY